MRVRCVAHHAEAAMSARDSGARAGRAFVAECIREGVSEIGPETLTRERMRAIIADHGVNKLDERLFLRGFWEAITRAAGHR